MAQRAIGCLIVLVLFAVSTNSVFATTYTVDLFAHVPGCGDALIQSGEECDGANLGGSTCESVGFSQGVLSCSSVCTFITASCVLNEPESGGGGGRRQVDELKVTDTNVVVSGMAAPGMSIALLKDGQRVATVPTKPDGSFQITVTGLSQGSYVMQVVGTLAASEVVRSSTFIVRVIKDSTTKISEVLLPPVLRTENTADATVLSGFTYPGVFIQLLINGVERLSAVSSDSGFYQFSLPRDSVAVGDAISVVTDYKGTKTVTFTTLKEVQKDMPAPSLCPTSADTNSDCKVDVIDFVIMKWSFLQSIFTSRFDLDGDGRVTIIDFSILAYNWTG